MTLKYGWQFNNLYMGQLWRRNLGGNNNYNSEPRYLYITVFPGVQPSAASIISSWSTYSAQYLAHFVSASPGWNLYNANTEGTAYIATSAPVTTTAYRTGTATWGIIWTCQNGPSEAAVQGASLPQTTFIVAPVGDFASNQIIRLQSTSIVATTTATLNLVTIQTALNPGD